nr:hypothetical protein [Tanacetum cinerariifolium]
LGKLTLMVGNPYVWPAPMNKMAGTPLGEMVDQTIMGSVHNSDHKAFASGYSCGRSLKASDTSALVSPTPIINMSQAGNHEELLSGMTNNMHEAAMDALSESIQDKHGSYIATAGGSRLKPSAARGSKLDASISKAKFCSLFSKNLCDGVYVSIPKKVWKRFSRKMALALSRLKSDVLKEILTIGVYLIEDTWFTIKIVSIPITVVTHVVPALIIEMTSDGFQTMGKKKKGRAEFCLVTGFACEKVVFLKYLDDGIPPFVRRLFLDKLKKLEKNKAGFEEAAKAAKGKAAQPSDKGDKVSVTIRDLGELVQKDAKWKKLSFDDSLDDFGVVSDNVDESDSYIG